MIICLQMLDKCLKNNRFDYRMFCRRQKLQIDRISIQRHQLFNLKNVKLIQKCISIGSWWIMFIMHDIRCFLVHVINSCPLLWNWLVSLKISILLKEETDFIEPQLLWNHTKSELFVIWRIVIVCCTFLICLWTFFSNRKRQF